MTEVVNRENGSPAFLQGVGASFPATLQLMPSILEILKNPLGKSGSNEITPRVVAANACWAAEYIAVDQRTAGLRAPRAPRNPPRIPLPPGGPHEDEISRRTVQRDHATDHPRASAAGFQAAIECAPTIYVSLDYRRILIVNHEPSGNSNIPHGIVKVISFPWCWLLKGRDYVTR